MTVADSTGVISAKALTITAQTNTKTYDSTTSAAAVPRSEERRVGKAGRGKAETYDTAKAGVGKTLSVSAYTVNDGNSGGNYTVTTVVVGLVGSDTVTGKAETYDTANAGVGKTLSV